MNEIAQISINEKRFIDAENELKKTIYLFENHNTENQKYYVYCNLAVVQYYLKRNDLKTTIQKSIQLINKEIVEHYPSPENANLYAFLGLSYLLYHDFGKSLDQCKFAENHFKLALEYNLFSKGRIKEFIFRLNQFIESTPPENVIKCTNTIIESLEKKLNSRNV